MKSVLYNFKVLSRLQKGSPMEHAIIMFSILYIDRSYFTLSQHRQRPKHARNSSDESDGGPRSFEPKQLNSL